MKLQDLKLEIDKILAEHPEAGASDVLVDTEARCYHAHMVKLENISFDPEMESLVGHCITTLHIDDSNTTFSE